MTLKVLHFGYNAARIFTTMFIVAKPERWKCQVVKISWYIQLFWQDSRLCNIYRATRSKCADSCYNANRVHHIEHSCRLRSADNIFSAAYATNRRQQANTTIILDYWMVDCCQRSIHLTYSIYTPAAAVATTTTTTTTTTGTYCAIWRRYLIL